MRLLIDSPGYKVARAGDIILLSSNAVASLQSQKIRFPNNNTVIVLPGFYLLGGGAAEEAPPNVSASLPKSFPEKS